MTQELADAIAFAVACDPEIILFNNTSQTCTQDCAGETLTYTVPPDVFVGLDQASADLTAFLFACAVLSLSCQEGKELPPPPTAPNTKQSCSVACTGGTFTYTVSYNTYRAENQSAANAVASTAACNLASTFLTCITPIDDETCVDDFYGQVVAVTGLFSGNVTSLVVSSGSLPPGVILSGNSLIGVPTVAGEYNFTLRATFNGGHTATTTGVITVGDVIGTLANGTDNAPYVGVVTAPGFTNPIFSIVGGLLPSGLALNPNTGVISGTPDTPGVYDFVVEASE
jgi:hypothetical protein